MALRYYTDTLGALYYTTHSTTTLTTLTTGSQAKSATRPCFAAYKKRLYITRQYGPRGIVISEKNTVHLIGIQPPTQAPTLTTSGTGITGSSIGYFTFLRIVNGVEMAESNPGPASNTLSLTNQGRAWGNLPTTSVDGAATHLAGYVAQDGDLIPKRAWVRTLGATSVTEAVPTAVLNNNTPLPSTSSGVLDSGARGVPPYAKSMKMWHDRGWIINDSAGVYFSKLYEPEAVDTTLTSSGFPTNFIPTRDGEIPTALGVLDDQLVLFCDTCFYVITGYGPSDFDMRKVPGFGCIAVDGPVNIQGVVFFPSQQGVCVYDGTRPRNVMARSLRNTWMADYASNASAFEAGLGADDWNGNYIFLTTRTSTPKTISYVGYYRAMTEEGALEPWWSIDKMDRQNNGVVILSDAGTHRPTMAYLDCDGFVRKEDSTDDDDDGDTFAKALTIRHPHFFFSDQSGDTFHGRQVSTVDVYCKHENNAITVSGYAGDDDARSGTATFTQSLAATASSGYVAQTSDQVKPAQLVGKGVTVEVTCSAPVGVEYRGIGFTFKDGPQSRPSV